MESITEDASYNRLGLDVELGQALSSRASLIMLKTQDYIKEQVVLTSTTDGVMTMRWEEQEKFNSKGENEELGPHLYAFFLLVGWLGIAES